MPDGASGDIVVASSWIGPLPSPNDLADYEAVCPGIAERIVWMTEAPMKNAIAESEHRRQIENDSFRHDRRMAIAGMTFGVAFVSFLLITGFICVLRDKPTIGMASIATAAAGLAGAFISARRDRQKQLETQMKFLNQIRTGE